MSKKSPSKISKLEKNQIARRDINHYHNNSDPIPILLIFCLFVFLVFAFVVALLLLSGKWRDRQENNTWNKQDFNIFVEPIEFFEAQNIILVSSTDKSVFSFPHRQDLSFNFKALPVIPQAHLTEIAQMHSNVRDDNDKGDYSGVRNRQERLDLPEDLTVNFPDFPILTNHQANPNPSGDRVTDLRTFFPISRALDRSNLLSSRDLVPTLTNSAKNSTAKILDRRDLVEFQPQPNLDEFSARIAIAHVQEPTFLPSSEKSSKPIPESTNGWSAIIIFLLAICLISRQKK